MRLRLPLALSIVSALVVSPVARAETAMPAGVPDLPTETVRLSNGLRVLLAPDPGARLVSINVRYAAGSADDPNGRSGLARLTEHLVSRCTKHIDHPFRVLEAAGGWGFNAETTLDDTTYEETVPPERLAGC